MPTRLSTSHYGRLADGRDANTYTLTNAQGLSAVLCDFGATLLALHAPDRTGRLADITLGYDTLDRWASGDSYFGATAGRYGNRIRHARFTLEGKTYTLAQNNGEHHLHGGDIGFNKRLWHAETAEKQGESCVRFTYTSPDGEEGYPGKLTCSVAYTLNDDNELRIDFEATTTRATPINLVHHTYWNLTGDADQTVLDHELTLPAERYCPIDPGGIPNDGLAPVEGTPFDFRQPRAIGARIHDPHEQLVNGKGYDHSWEVPSDVGTLRLAAQLYEPGTGRTLEVHTDQPAIQFYSGNFLDGEAGKAGTPMKHRTGLCLETQVFPDSPNQPELSNAILRPGERYRHAMVHKFGVR
ncbi:MAG: aldose epimerase family protein [Phycisphaerales bacterium JB063]